jgi:hypothetical protein
MNLWLRYLLGQIIVAIIIIFVIIPYFDWYNKDFWKLFFLTLPFGIGYFIGEGILLLFNFIRDKFN